MGSGQVPIAAGQGAFRRLSKTHSQMAKCFRAANTEIVYQVPTHSDREQSDTRAEQDVEREREKEKSRVRSTPECATTRSIQTSNTLDVGMAGSGF